MPFRCKCGRTFEKTDTFASHTSACAPFHQRRMSESNAVLQQQNQQHQQQQKKQPPFINTNSLGFISTGILSPTQQSPSSSSQASSPSSTNAIGNSANIEMSSSIPSYFMPTGLTLQHAFEGARRRSMSYGSTNASLK
ncbi:hypothetical protein INT45_011049 [Circinella minor]|uniref:Uncharacterized protein n=1 Tax=Circinella minor TaxID=1195481 RepID=A0A8H7SFC4_9FUNG|nr:hypothetical protein INT45_011049 [Circinella minor]